MKLKQKYCIMCFLDEGNHLEWRAMAQKIGFHNHEHVAEYEKLLLSIYDNLIPIHKCLKHSFVNVSTYNFWKNAQRTISFNVVIKDFFVIIKEVLALWNRGLVVEATNLFNSFISILEKSGETLATSNLPCFLFRDRIKCGRGDSIQTSDDLSHISFKKRYLVRNYRFSISGRPILYLGTSLADILYELRQEDKDEKELKKNHISVYILKKLSCEQKNLKIFDLTNPFMRIASNLEAFSNNGGYVSWDSKTFGKWDEKTVANIKILLLMSCCSFKTINENKPFQEEYILPQMLMEILQKKGYDAIKYSSTRLTPQMCIKKGKHIWHENYLRENYAFFTKYSDQHEYDLRLKDFLFNSRPVKYNPISSIQKKINVSKVLDAMTKYFIKHQKEKGCLPEFDDEQAWNMFVVFKLMREKINIKGSSYLNSIYAQNEIQMVCGALLEFFKQHKEYDSNDLSKLIKTLIKT